MKLGVLLCDHVQPHLQADFGDYAAMFAAIISTSGIAVELQFFDVVNGEFPAHIDVCDCYITTGSKYGVNDDLVWLAQLTEFVLCLHRAKKGFVGICFGHQLIAHALGGSVEKSTKGWGIGIAKADIVKDTQWMVPKSQSINLVVSHQDQISTLPTDAEVLLTSDFCPFSMYKIGEHFLGIQGHPEFTRIYSYALMDSRRDRIPAGTITAAVGSLSWKTDDVLMMKWLLLFLQKTVQV
ncbi:glutamine amidotransferase-related protein [Colwellia sp. E150_009]